MITNARLAALLLTASFVAEVLTEYSTVVADGRGIRYHAHACGAPMPDGRWQGWIEFIPLGGGEPVRSGRETTQPNRADTIYWATGVSAVYLEGALQRALAPPQPVPVTSDAPAFDGPAERVRNVASAPERLPAIEGEAVLDPFSVYAKGETLLRRQLAALSAWHLVNIIRTYSLSSDPSAALSQMTIPELIDRIVSGVSRGSRGSAR